MTSRIPIASPIGDTIREPSTIGPSDRELSRLWEAINLLFFELQVRAPLSRQTALRIAALTEDLQTTRTTRPPSLPETTQR